MKKIFDNQEETDKEKPPVPKKRTSVKQDTKEEHESKENEQVEQEVVYNICMFFYNLLEVISIFLIQRLLLKDSKTLKFFSFKDLW